MKRKFTFLTAALALLAFLAIPVGMWGQTIGEISWTASEQGYSNQQEITDVDFDDVVSATFNKGTNSNAPKYYTSGSAIRCYGGNNFVFSTASGNITEIVINFGNSDGSNEITTNVGTYSNGTWTGEAEEITFTIGGTTGNRRIAGFNITYTTGGSTTVATTTTIDDSGITNTDVYESTAAGSLSATVTETESGDAVSSATVTWTSSKESVATIDEDGVVTLVAAGTTTITASYAGVSGEFGASSATYELTVTSSAPYVQPTEFEIGLNNTLFGTNYNGSVSGITDANPIVGTQENVTVTYAGGGSHYVNDAQIRFYPNNKLTFEAPEGYEIKKIVFTADGQWNATISADGGTYDSDTKTWTGSATSVLFIGSGSSVHCRMSKATITLSAPSEDAAVTLQNYNINVLAEGGEGILTVQYQNIDEIEADIQFYEEDGETETTAAYYENWLTAGIDSDNNVSYLAIENTGTERKAYFKVFALDNQAENVYSELITVTQAAPAPKYIATVASNISNGTVKIVDGTEETTIIEVEEGTEITLTATPESGYALNGWNVYKDGDPTETVTVSNNKFNMPAYDVIISATFVEATTYTLITSTDELVSGKRYVIAGVKNDVTYALGKEGTNNRPGVSVEISNNTITGNNDVCEVVIIGPDADGFYSLYDVAKEEYLYAAHSNSNYLKSQNPNDNNGRWTIEFEENAANIVAQGSNSRNIMRFNPNGNNNPLFSCYNGGQQPIYLYAKDNETTVTKTMSIEGYSTATNPEGGYYLIASPFGQVAPTEANGFLTPDYDLYRFDQTQEQEWRNYKQQPFNLVSGHGYLYANSGGVTLTFEGMPYNGNGQVFLSYTEGANWAGWNLIGNPFNAAATIPSEISYYTMNEDGSDLTPGESCSVGAKEGIFVLATGTEQFVTFTQGAKANAEHNARLVLNLNSNSKLIDRAIVRFGEGQTLPKFMLNEAHTKLYFTQNGTDYAVVRSEGEGEMPINFKVEHNGTYTIGISAKDMEFSRLRLIDNMTGADIDLLATPSYTFEAKTTDYASRFRLVFSSTGIEENENANFAYYNGSEWVINATDNATVEVIDMMGRVIRVCTGGVHTLSTNGMASGVYMMRLIDGNNVKTQKIVVR
ncbi:MAG: T9SS type A sorting domain-containing protein [Bacteroidales bacterium]|nr:T9SS type A sorting domain-containing protein [Bacteroidales bacterium]